MNSRDLTEAERRRFVQALSHVKSTGTVDRFADVHRDALQPRQASTRVAPTSCRGTASSCSASSVRCRGTTPTSRSPTGTRLSTPAPLPPLWADSFLGQFDAARGLRRALGSAQTADAAAGARRIQGRGTYDAFWPELETRHPQPPARVGRGRHGTAPPRPATRSSTCTTAGSTCCGRGGSVRTPGRRSC